ncbi:MAG: NAD-dependent epimerase/dehydratase family protein [Burkholderiaceae bacterium]
MNLLGALPARFRRERVLIVGCGDVGLRTARTLGAGRRVRLLALTSDPQRSDPLRRAGITPLVGDLDVASTIQRMAGLATRIVHLAPPPSEGDLDTRTRALLRALARRSAPATLVYGSTSGVYGDRQGRWVNETAPVAPQTARAWRRVDAERWIHAYGRMSGTRTMVLRIPGIYAPDREGGTPHARLLRGTPVLRAEDDVYTNHIHADDLARACTAALWRARPGRNVNVTDDTELRMGDYFDLAADLYGLPRPPRVPLEVARADLPATLLSFMGESRRLHNARMKRELRLGLRYPTVRDGLRPQDG